MLRLILLFTFAALVAADETTPTPTPCSNYVDHMKPLLESGDIAALSEAFLTINHVDNAVVPKLVHPIERTVVVDKHNIQMLISLSRPFLEMINSSDAWPQNSNVIESESVASKKFHEEFTPMNSFHGGIRYLHSCQTLQERSCFKRECRINPNVPIINGDAGKEVYIPLENFLAANGSAMMDHVMEVDEVFRVVGFSRMSVRECLARQLFVVPSEEGCFNTSKYFSLPERVETYHWGSNRIGVAEKTAYFLVML